MKAIIYKTKKGCDAFERSEETFIDYKETIPPFAEGGKHPGDLEANQLRIYPKVEYGTWQGFGGAITEAAAVALSRLPEAEQEKLLKLYFSKEDGIGYNYCRLPIGSCDFSTDAYSYVEEGDEDLSTFDVSRDDKTIFNVIKKAQKHNPELRFIASPWTPPRYMKTNNEWQGGNLKKEYYSLWAKYFAKYINECRKRDINIEAVTVQNEPRHHQMWESCTYTPEEELEFVNNYLAKELKPMGVKIFVYDHCKERVFERAEYAFKNGGDNVDGIACHWYSGDYFDELRMVRERWPNKEIVMSEGCVALTSLPPDENRQWQAAEQYLHDIFGNINNGLTAFCDWNMTLDENRGPFHFREGRHCVADSPIISDNKEQKAVVQPSYYAIGHFSKFIRKGAKIIGTSKGRPSIELTAAKNPDGSIVIVIYNSLDADRKLILHLGDQILPITFESKSIYTVVVPPCIAR